MLFGKSQWNADDADLTDFRGFFSLVLPVYIHSIRVTLCCSAVLRQIAEIKTSYV